MAGDHFPNRFFPERFFPARYFQGAEAAAPGEISASLSATGTLNGTISAKGIMSASLTATASVSGRLENGATVEPPVVVPISGSTGGGGAARWYAGKYRGEVRRALLRAAKKLSSIKATDGNKKRKKKLRKVAAILQDASIVSMPRVADVSVGYQPLESLRLTAISVSVEVLEKKIEHVNAIKKAQEIFDRYEREILRIEKEEEEQALIAVMALLAA